jgi:hypothetical protein
MKMKNIIYAMLCICVAFVITGCGKSTHGSIAPTNVPEATATFAPTASPTDAEKEPTIVPPENFEITIYTLNPDSLEKEAVTVLVTANDELTPEFIVEQVIDAMEDEGFYIGINDIIIDGESVRIDFKSDAAPVIDVGASVEGSIIDILAQSILDNLSQYKKIYISIEGGPYYTGHIEFELDEVYLGR